MKFPNSFEELQAMLSKIKNENVILKSENITIQNISDIIFVNTPNYSIQFEEKALDELLLMLHIYRQRRI